MAVGVLYSEHCGLGVFWVWDALHCIACMIPQGGSRQMIL